MAFRLAYLMLARVLSWLVRVARGDDAKQVDFRGVFTAVALRRSGEDAGGRF